MYTRPQLELKLMDMSARSLGEAEDETETDAQKLKEKQANHARWEARGQEIKQEIRESLTFSFLPDHMQATHVYLNGMPGESKRKAVTPLEGVSQGVARSLLKLITAQTFSRDEWAKSKLWAQLRNGDARARLEATVKE
jgi:hypothetical protein